MNLMPLRDAGEGFQAAGNDGILGIRPEDIVISSETPAGGLAMPAGGLALNLTVEAIERVGAEAYVYRVPAKQGDAPTISTKPGELPPGEVIVRVPRAGGPPLCGPL